MSSFPGHLLGDDLECTIGVFPLKCFKEMKIHEREIGWKKNCNGTVRRPK